MSTLVVGMSYRTAPVELLEKMTIGPDEIVGVLHGMVAGEHVREAMVVSTCNRIEVYADVEKFHGGLAELSTRLAERGGLDVGALAGRLFAHYEDAAVEHLFQVAAGLDSMVIGEAQILGQLRTAYATAQQAGTLGAGLHPLVQQALRVGKRAHSDTGIDDVGRSLVTVGLDQAGHDLAGRPAVVIGAGSMAALVTATLQRRGIGPITVVSRTLSSAQRLAAGVDGLALPMDRLDDALPTADLVVSCTAATLPVLTAPMVELSQKARDGAPVLVLDLGLPRDVEQAVAGVEGVQLVDLNVLKGATASDSVSQQVAAAHVIVAEEVQQVITRQQSRRVVPTVTALRSRADEVVAEEVQRLAGRLPQLDPAARAEVEMSIHRVVSTLLHVPTVRVKELAGTPDGEVYAEALRELFCLDPTGDHGQGAHS